MESEKINNSKKQSSKHYIITYHCDETYDWKQLLTDIYAKGRYTTVSGQLERGKKSGKVHVQGYLGCKTQTRGATVLQDLPSGSWFKQPSKFQHDRANVGPRMYEYSTKEDTRISNDSLTLGDPPVRVNNSINGKKGRDAQLERYEEAYEFARQGEFSFIPKDLLIKHHTTLKRIHVEEKKKTEPEPFSHELRDWQKYAMDAISNADPRSVLWIYDDDGNAGKSTFCKWLNQRSDTYYMDGGKKEDHLFLIKEEHLVLLIDLPRCYKREYVPYALIETFKTGCWTSTKYEGNFVNRRLPGTVIVFANMLPDVSKLSKDRWDILRIIDGRKFEKMDYLELLYNTNEQYRV